MILIQTITWDLKHPFINGNGYQSDDGSQIFTSDMVGNHHFHPLRNGCLGFIGLVEAAPWWTFNDFLSQATCMKIRGRMKILHFKEEFASVISSGDLEGICTYFQNFVVLAAATND